MTSTISPKILADLTPDETIVWNAAPNPVALFIAKQGVVGAAISSIIGGAFCWIGLRAPRGTGWFIFLIGSVVVGAVLREAIAGFWTEYAITNRRLIILHPSPFSTVIQSFYPPDIEFLKKIRRRSGKGSIVFSAVREQKGKRTQTVEFGFFGLSDVNLVEAKILALRLPQNA